MRLLRLLWPLWTLSVLGLPQPGLGRGPGLRPGRGMWQDLERWQDLRQGLPRL